MVGRRERLFIAIGSLALGLAIALHLQTHGNLAPFRQWIPIGRFDRTVDPWVDAAFARRFPMMRRIPTPASARWSSPRVLTVSRAERPDRV